MDEQKSSRIPAKVFRDNLQRLASLQQLDLDGFASTLGFVRDDKKWLRRAWNEGLARPDKRAIPRLEKISGCLGLSDLHELWKPQLIANQETVLHTIQTNDDIWQDLVAKIIKYVDAVQTLRVFAPVEAEEIEAKYDFDMNKMIASWVRSEIDPKQSVKNEEISRILAETQAVREFRQQTSLRGRVRDRLCRYKEWVLMIEDLHRTLQKEATSQEIERRLNESISRLPAEQEVLKRFYDKYLAEYTAPDEELEEEENERLYSFIEGVQDHWYWNAYVQARYNGVDDDATAAMIEMWDELEEKSGGTILVETAVEFIHTRIFDDFEIKDCDDKTMPGELGNSRQDY